MKTVTAFIASGRKQKGHTYAATRQLLDNLESYGDVETEIVFLSEHDLGLCRGCRVCFLRGEERCPLKGDRDVLIEKMMASDGVVFATPNYSFHVSAIMKAFLDRLGFVFHRPCFFGKTFTSVVTQGFYGGGKIEKYLDFVGAGLGFNTVKGSCITALAPMPAKARRKMDKAVATQARRFHERLLAPALPVPSLFRLLGFRMGRAATKYTLGEEDRDYVYYRDRGWLESDYFYPTRLGPLKQAVGAIVDYVGARHYESAEPAAQPAPVASASAPAASVAAR